MKMAPIEPDSDSDNEDSPYEEIIDYPYLNIFEILGIPCAETTQVSMTKMLGEETMQKMSTLDIMLRDAVGAGRATKVSDPRLSVLDMSKANIERLTGKHIILSFNFEIGDGWQGYRYLQFSSTAKHLLGAVIEDFNFKVIAKSEYNDFLTATHPDHPGFEFLFDAGSSPLFSLKGDQSVYLSVMVRRTTDHLIARDFCAHSHSIPTAHANGGSIWQLPMAKYSDHELSRSSVPWLKDYLFNIRRPSEEEMKKYFDTANKNAGKGCRQLTVYYTPQKV